MRKVLPLIHRAVTGAALLAALLPLHALAADLVVARSGKATVTQQELEAFLRTLDAPARQRLAADKATLENLVKNRLAQKAVLAEAEAKGWTKRPEVAERVREAQESVVMRSYLESVAEPPQGYPSDAELKAAYTANAAAFTVPRLYHLAQVFIAADGGEAAQARARRQADEVARQARAAGADFAALAKSRSQEPRSAANGGDNGWLAEADMIAEIRTAVTALKPGAVAGPVRSGAGFHVLKLVAVREPGQLPFDEVRERLRATLRQQYQADAAQQYLKQQVQAQGADVLDQAALDGVISAVR
ncbi:hypothetical protein BKK79_36975 (plasmid) [Cupriavidus sp. USMAA2-4]|uniref:peptidylprolyl isomerase n=1 Tax=Cupriavidus sp. USMAA2-4 TaxID=876364 RepID=UPI0008A66EE7|nr:peptidylprolyl isomerase [Cupriavidus sp. USMAA2-4]AOY97536.1 hypothetical protein BKK79_36975 [Cupriavidus sp. USMAA2-4]